MSTPQLPELPFPPKGGPRRDQLARRKYLTAVNDLAAQRFLDGDVQGSWDLAQPFFQFADECPYFAELHAAHLMRRGQLDQALERIALAVSHGFEHTEALRTDPTYEPLRADPRWQQVFRTWDATGFIESGYSVDVETLAAADIPPLLRAFGLLLRKTPRGAFGYFEVDKRRQSQLSPTARPFLVLGEGSEAALEPDGSVVLLDSEGEPPRQLAPTLRDFLALLADANTTVSDLDRDKLKGAGRGKLRDFLQAQSGGSA
jgi:hypothetical protein